MKYVELIKQQANFVFGNKSKANTWLNQPKATLGDRSPIELARDEVGYRIVRDALERIDHGYAS